MMTTHKELQSFIEVLTQFKEMEEKHQQQVVLLLDKQGLSLKQCVTMANKANNSHNFSTQGRASKAQYKIKKILVKIRKIYNLEQREKKELIKNQGFNIRRFNQIVQEVLQNTSMQQKIREHQELKQKDKLELLLPI